MLLHCDAARDVLERRVRDRANRSDDASEADLEVLSAQFDKLEPLSAAEFERAVVVNTADTLDPDALAGELRHRARRHREIR